VSLKTLKKIRYLKIGKKEYDLLEIVGIDEDNLDIEFRDHPETVLFWFRLKAREAAHLRRLEDDLETVRRVRFKQYWELYESERGTSSFSDSLIWAEVHNDDEVAKARKEVRLAKTKFEAVKAVCDAMEHRKSSLINLGALQRRDEELSIRRNRSGED